MLSLREKAAQLVFPRLGSNMPPPVTVDEDLERAEALLDRVPVGGFIVFNGRLPQLPDALARLQSESSLPLLIASDIERGAGQQVRGATVFPHALAFSKLGDEGPSLLDAAVRVTAREALAAGVHIAFAPDADLHRNPRNPIIATRAFGTTVQEAVPLIESYIRAARAEGMLTTAKHFPGHGNTSEDSHAMLPLVDATYEELDRLDLAPFRAAIDAGVDLMMTAHLRVPSLDPNGVPATLSHAILVDLLRIKMGFRGAVISDSLLMGAIRQTHPLPGDQAVGLVKAGVDILLDPPDTEAYVDGIVAGVHRGELEESRLNEAVERVQVLRNKLLDRFGKTVFTDPGSLFAEESPESKQALARRIGRRAAVVLSVENGALPIPPAQAASEGLVVLFMQPHKTHLDPVEAPLGRAVRETYPTAQYLELGPEATTADYANAYRMAEPVRHVVVAMVVRPAAWRAFGLLPAQQEFVETLAARRPVLLASLGSPDVFFRLPEARARICTFSDVAVSQEALVGLLAGIDR